MDFILLFIICLQFGFIVYKDIAVTKEREKLQLKLMSRDIEEYVEAIEPEVKDAPKQEEDPYVPLDEVPIEQIIKAKDIG